MHDWYSKTGQGVGGEYRYNFGGGSDGNLRRYLLDQQAIDLRRRRQTCTRRAQLRDPRRRQPAAARQHRARGRTSNYFSSIVDHQTFNTNVNDASRNQRSYGGNVVGAWRQLLAERHVRSQRVLLRHDQLGRHRQLAARVARAERTAAVRRLAGLLLGEQRVRAHPAARPRPTAIDDRRRSLTPARLRAADPLSVQEVAVVHRQLVAQLARHLLHAQLRADRRPATSATGSSTTT